MHAQLLVERVEGRRACCPEFGFARRGVVELAFGPVFCLFNGVVDGLGPLLDGFGEPLHKFGVAANLLVRHFWGDVWDVYRNVSVGLLEGGLDVLDELLHMVLEVVPFFGHARHVNRVDHL